MFLLKKPADSTILAFLAAQKATPLSYAPIGLTKNPPAQGYNIDRTRVRLGNGEAVFLAAQHVLQQWKMFDLGWVQLFYPNTPLIENAVVAIVVRHLGFWSMNACRIVYVIAEDDENGRRYGFAYGTLRDHAERGEERFMIEWDTRDDSVWYDILAVSRPGLLATLGYWYTRRLQRKFALDSTQAMEKAVVQARGV